MRNERFSFAAVARWVLAAGRSVRATSSRLPLLSSGEKLEAALGRAARLFPGDAQNLRGVHVLDVGASTGGFTDCCLQARPRRHAPSSSRLASPRGGLRAPRARAPRRGVHPTYHHHPHPPTIAQSAPSPPDVAQRGAASVTCVDVGHAQLHPRLAADARVVANLEGVNARRLRADAAGRLPRAAYGLVVADLSFISLTLVLPEVEECCVM